MEGFKNWFFGLSKMLGAKFNALIDTTLSTVIYTLQNPFRLVGLVTLVLAIRDLFHTDSILVTRVQGIISYMFATLNGMQFNTFVVLMTVITATGLVLITRSKYPR